ncbi:MAG TPA: hypothetical protein VH477_13720 [Bryobacteraceae bacterium]|jgi:hypothetical protein
MVLEAAAETRHDLFAKAEKLLAQRDVEQALKFFDLAERAACDPDRCAAGRWTCYMLSGRFENAWRESDSIFARGKPDPNRYWNGQSPADKRVLIRCLHGLGDTIQFIRYAPILRRMARSVAIEAQPNLRKLLAASELADFVFTWGEREPEWDAQVEVIELPRMFRTTVDSIPNRIPYLRAPRKRPGVGDGFGLPRVGVVWSASSYNPARSIPPEQIASLFDTPGVDIFSLQTGPERLALAVPSLQNENADLLLTAGIVNELDLLITVDTMMAHLAGALGVPVWMLLPCQSDWRWMLKRSDSPWYPTMRLMRQPSPGDWPAVIQTARADLLDLVRLRSRKCEEESGTTSHC